MNHAQVRAIFVSTMDHLETVQSIQDQVPSLEKVIVFYPEGLLEDDARLQPGLVQDPWQRRFSPLLSQLSRRAQPSDTVTIVYTSGTTGDPNGVVLTHRNFIAEYDTVYPFFEGRRRQPAFLSPAVAHLAAGSG